MSNTVSCSKFKMTGFLGCKNCSVAGAVKRVQHEENYAPSPWAQHFRLVPVWNNKAVNHQMLENSGERSSDLH